MKRSTRRNTGKSLEAIIQTAGKIYETRGVLTLEKVDPPTFTMTIKGARVTRLLPNPFPDFIGCLTECGGVFVGIEAKSTQEDRLAFGKSGIRTKQLADLWRWQNSLGIVGVIWQTPRAFYWVGLDDISKASEQGRKSVRCENVTEIKAGRGIVLDFVPVLLKKYLK